MHAVTDAAVFEHGHRAAAHSRLNCDGDAGVAPVRDRGGHAIDRNGAGHLIDTEPSAIQYDLATDLRGGRNKTIDNGMDDAESWIREALDCVDGDRNWPGTRTGGTTATICVSLQLVIDDAAVPLKLQVLVPCVAPKWDPVTVTVAPILPNTGSSPVTNGVVPIVTDTLSKVAVAAEEVLPLITPRPMS